MKHVVLAEAEASVAELCREVARTCEDVVIVQDGVPLVRITPLPIAPAGSTGSAVWDAVRDWEALNPCDADFEPAPRIDAERSLVGEESARPAPGLGRGSILYMAPDFGETPAEFQDDGDERGNVMSTREELLQRISIDPRMCGGKPCIRGHRVWVSLILDFLASGSTNDELLANYPGLEVEDIRACIAYGAEMSRERYIDVPLKTAP